MNIHDKLAPYKEQRNFNSRSFDNALLRAGAIIIAGYLLGTLIAWIISR